MYIIIVKLITTSYNTVINLTIITVNYILVCYIIFVVDFVYIGFM